MDVPLQKVVFLDDQFLDSLHKSFLNQTTLDLRKEKWTFLNQTTFNSRKEKWTFLNQEFTVQGEATYCRHNGAT